MALLPPSWTMRATTTSRNLEIAVYRLSPPELGVYDQYAIEWNYRYFPQYDGDLEKRNPSD